MRAWGEVCLGRMKSWGAFGRLGGRVLIGASVGVGLGLDLEVVVVVVVLRVRVFIVVTILW